jgi:predicted DNA binding CopG/RHH family protein
MKKHLPKLMNDEVVEEFLSEDLTEYLNPENFKENFVPVSFEIAPDEEIISIQDEMRKIEQKRLK